MGLMKEASTVTEPGRPGANRSAMPTTQVIDTDVRVDLQRRSIERISVLLDRARSIREGLSRLAESSILERYV